MNMYVVGVDSNNNLSPCNFVTKSNLKTWLGRNKMINDTIDILDGHVVNFGIEYKVLGSLEYNQQQVQVEHHIILELLIIMLQVLVV